MFFKIIMECFSAPVASSLSAECNVFEMDKKTLLFLLLAEGRASNASPHDVLHSVDTSICIKLRGMIFLPYLILKADMSAVAACSL